MAPRPRDPGMDEVSALIGAIYDCAVDPALWQPTLDALRRELACANCAMSVLDTQQNLARLHVVVGIEPQWQMLMEGYAADVNAANGAIPDFMTRPLDEPFVARTDIPQSVLRHNRYFTEWALPQGLFDCIQLVLMRTSDRTAGIAFGRHESEGPIGEREVRILRLLSPHLRRAVTIADLIDTKALEARTLAATLDSLAIGVVLVDAGMTILHANQAATEMLADGRLVSARNGRLKQRNDALADRLRQAVSAIADGNVDAGPAGFGVPLGGADGSAATAHVLPFDEGTVRHELEPRAVAAVFISSGASPRPSAVAAAAQAFGLTPAETRVVSLLASGETVMEAAKALNIRLPTARTHLSRALSKTGTKRQSDLVALLHRLAPGTVAPAPD